MIIRYRGWSFKEFSRTLRAYQQFQFSQQGKPIFEGLILSQKIKYTSEDNFNYAKLYQQNYNIKPEIQTKSENYVNRMLLGSIFSRIIGTSLSMSIYLSQKMEILNDVPLNTEVQGFRKITVSPDHRSFRHYLKWKPDKLHQWISTNNVKIVKDLKRTKHRKKRFTKRGKDTQQLMNIQKSNLRIRSKFYILFIALTIATGSFIFGYTLVGTSLLEKEIQQQNKISNEQIHYYLSIVITLLPLGAIVGSLMSAKVVSLIGQKNAMIFVDILMAFAIIAQSFSLDLQVLYFTRFIFGFFCGISSAIIPPYLTSISPLEMTGFIGSLNQLLITIGISVAYGMNFFLESDILQKEYSIPIFVIIPLPFCIIRVSVLSLMFPYDTVERHYQRKQYEQVKKIMNLIYKKPSYKEFCIKKNLKEQQPLPQGADQKMTDSSKTRRHHLTPLGKKRILLISIVLAISNQFCGINAIMFYAKQLFTNLTGGDQEWIQRDLFGLGIFQVIMTFVSSFLLDKFGRRPLMLAGESIIVFSLFAAYFATDILNMSSGVIVFLIFLHIFGFSISLGPICCLYASQILQDISVVIIVIWVETLIVAMISDMMIAELGIGKTFLIFGVISLGCLVYFWKEMIESKGKNRDKLQQEYSQIASHVLINSDEEQNHIQINT